MVIGRVRRMAFCPMRDGMTVCHYDMTGPGRQCVEPKRPVCKTQGIREDMVFPIASGFGMYIEMSFLGNHKTPRVAFKMIQCRGKAI
jgi:hypothetical protein